MRNRSVGVMLYHWSTKFYKAIPGGNIGGVKGKADNSEKEKMGSVLQTERERRSSQERSSQGVDELLLQRKSHGSTWLIGRCANPDKRSTSGPTDSEITYLTIKIRQEVVNEMEEKKVRENLTWVLMKLSEANPSININLTELCATISSDNDNGTHATS
ncbi:hypothetical protein POM88_023527 [Heracleum sosnowskyi]|uniref:Uncharacterized protein n=1 Tax=Heracleum sosnowskyi TaxID=360622 RepID=A0AAD8IH80_9APIA|nr:hypothetical protein POM88_023527 [Heracleum sosnowskyi]